MKHILCTAFLLASLPAFAQPAMPSLLTVAGQGDISAVPDGVVITTGVITSAKTAREALGANSQAMTAVFDALKKQGVPEKAIRTNNLSLQPQYANIQGVTFNDRPITGYRASNTVRVSLDDIRRAGAILDALVGAGANEASSLSYVFKNSQALLDQARADAIHSAMDRAKVYAQAAGITLGPIHAISDTNANGFFPVEEVVVSGSRLAPPAPPPPPPIGVGEQTLRANVTMSWEIRQP